MTAAARPKGREAPPHTDVPVLATPAAQFRQGALYRLPGSGHVVRLRIPSLYALITAGEVPNPLRAEVTRLLTAGGGGADTSEEARLELTRKNIRTFVEITARCLVEPRLVLDREPDYERGEIGVGDLHDRDYDWVYFDFANKGHAHPDVAEHRLP